MNKRRRKKGKEKKSYNSGTFPELFTNNLSNQKKMNL